MTAAGTAMVIQSIGDAYHHIFEADSELRHGQVDEAFRLIHFGGGQKARFTGAGRSRLYLFSPSRWYAGIVSLLLMHGNCWRARRV
jgi:hypothetical protein